MNKVLLCILDGYGEGKDYEGNALKKANTPTFDMLKKEHPWTLLRASGQAVGIPVDTQGGSEVGHLTMGAGRIVLQPLQAIDTSIADGSFFQKPELLAAAAHAKENNSAFHILGMISDQGVHADIRHAFALLKFASEQGLKKVFVHAITDGRDVPPKTAKKFIQQLLDKNANIATLVGRYFAMDRDTNLERTEKAFRLLTQGEGEKADNAMDAVDNAYAANTESDYYIEPTLINPDGLIKKEDSVVFFNFRTDRAEQLTEMLITKLNPYMAVFGAYTEKAPVVFPPQSVINNLGSIIANAGLKQLRIAETEKYAHVTFFFNSQEKDPFPHEDRIMVDSPKCASYADQPEMSAKEITDKLLPKFTEDYSFIVLNFANLDLVGHSGNFKATIKAVEVIDKCLRHIIQEATKNGFTILITGDHGNAEYMLYEDGTGCPSHTKNPVPLHIIGAELKKFSHTEPTGGLQDIAPTILTQLNLPIPEEMTGRSLV